MTPVDMLAAPIRALLDAVGDGSLPAAGPTTALRDASAAIDSGDARVRHALDALVRDWQSTAADDAGGAIARHRQQSQHASDDGATMASIIDDAAQSIRMAAVELRAILDSFVAATDALGPSLYTPVGFAAVLPIASDHLRRAMAVVDRTRTHLDRLSRRLSAIGRRQAPGSPGDVAAIRNRLTSALGDAGRTFTDPFPAAKDGVRTRSAAAGSGDDGTAASAQARAGGPPTPGAVPITLPDGSVAYAPNQRAATAVRAALSQRGVPYVWGGTSPGRGLDCSGLTQYAYRQAGVELPRLAQNQDTAGYRVDRAELLPGDLAVWSGHVAMYVGNNQMVEAGNPVQVSPVRTNNLDQAFEGFYRPR